VGKRRLMSEAQGNLPPHGPMMTVTCQRGVSKTGCTKSEYGTNRVYLQLIFRRMLQPVKVRTSLQVPCAHRVDTNYQQCNCMISYVYK
jgi:hypothetical protein